MSLYSVASAFVPDALERALAICKPCITVPKQLIQQNLVKYFSSK